MVALLQNSHRRVQLLFTFIVLNQQIAAQGAMTTNNNFFPGISIAEDGECDCLGRLRNGQQFFLSNQRNLDLQARPSPIQKIQAKNPNDTSTGACNKRSLRKGRQTICLSPQLKVETSIQHEYFPPICTAQPNERRENKLKQYREAQYKYSRPKIQFDFSSSKQQLRINQQPSLARINSCQNLLSGHQAISKIGPIVDFGSTHPPRQHQPLSPRVGFRYDCHQFSPMTPRIQTQASSNKKMETKPQRITEPYSLKDLPSVQYLTLKGFVANEAEQLKTERSIRSIKSKHSEGSQLNRNMLFVPKKQEQVTFGKFVKETAQSIIQHDKLRSKVGFTDKRKYLEPGRQRIDPKNSGIEGIGRVRIGGKKAKPGKVALKRINDVDQICSVMDSQQASESDKESVVLGRLREYGSVVEASAAITTPSTQSKVGYQSTTAQKSMLRAFESFQFR